MDTAAVDMTFPFNVYGPALVAAAVVTALSLPWWQRRCRDWRLVDDPGHRKIHDRPVPLAGGLALLSGLLFPLAAGAILLASGLLRGSGTLEPYAADLFAYGFSRRGVQLLVMLAGALGMAALGLLDDRQELRPGPKFAGQTAIALAVALAGIRITLFVESAWFGVAVTVLWIVTVTNACNFLDNMNGLCAGLGAIGCWSFGWSAAFQGQFLVAAIGFLTCGALLGFLPFNFPKARTFLGDTGSQLVGYLLAVLAILPSFYSTTSPHRFAVLKPVLVLGVFLGDLIWVVLLRWRRGQPFYIGDTNHLSHRLVRRGLSPTTAVLVIWLMAALLAAASHRL